jgi:hypothetical protein
MKRQAWVGVFLGLIVGSGPAVAQPPDSEPGHSFLQCVGPAGGWCPYGSPLGWWKPHCFPCCGAPDDYCRKKCPDVCRPAYPPWYIWVSSPPCHPQGGCCPPVNEPR